ASELGTIYPDDYYAYQLIERRAAAAGRSGDSLLARYMGWQLQRRLRPTVERARARHGPPYRILDIGCSDGAMLDAWRQAFGGAAAAETHGVELSPRAAAIARSRGHQIIDRRIEEAALRPRQFDLVYSFHVIEHVEDPSAFLAQTR